MAEIPTLDPSEAPRARRWDALILGSGISALIAGARISAAGHRVLVVEEEARATQPPAMKEPFALTGLRDGGALDTVLRALTVPLIDRRRIGNERLAYQVAADPYRLEVGQPVVTADELVTWGLAKPEAAQQLVRRLLEASETERESLLESPFVRLGRRGLAARGTSGMAHPGRGAQAAFESTSPALRRVLDAQVRALSNLGQSEPSPEARTRLLGLGLAGGAGFADDPPWLADLFRKRLTSLYGEMRTLSGDFELVAVADQPGVRIARTGEIWLGRKLVLAAPPSALRDQIGKAPLGPPPDVLSGDRSRAYRAAFLFRIPQDVLPEGMSARLILPRSDATGPDAPTVALTAFPCLGHRDRVDLVARAVIQVDEPAELVDRLKRLGGEIDDRLRALMPFCGDALALIDVAPPRWDGDDGWLEDPEPGQGWPGDIDLRSASRLPVYRLDRAGSAGLGLEGDLMLGLRGGDAIAQALA